MMMIGASRAWHSGPCRAAPARHDTKLEATLGWFIQRDTHSSTSSGTSQGSHGVEGPPDPSSSSVEGSS